MQTIRTVRPGRNHPFRQSLEARRARAEDQDIKLFVLSFSAFFVCFATFLL